MAWILSLLLGFGLSEFTIEENRPSEDENRRAKEDLQKDRLDEKRKN